MVESSRQTNIRMYKYALQTTITFNHCFSLWSFYAQWHCSGVHCNCVMFYCFTFPSHNNSAFIHNASNPIIRLNSVKILLSQNIFFILLSAKQTCRSWCCLLVRSRQHWREGGGQLVCCSIIFQLLFIHLLVCYCILHWIQPTYDQRLIVFLAYY